MSAPSIADILAFAGRNEIKGTLLAFLDDPDFAITDWNSGAVARTILELEAEVINDMMNGTDGQSALGALPLILTEGFADTSDGDWLSAVAHGLYGLDKILGTFALQTVTIACSATAGPYVFTAGVDYFLGSDGRRYVAATGGTLSPSGTLPLDVMAESPGAAGGLVNLLESPRVGVSVLSSAIKVISGVSQFGSNDESDGALSGRCEARWPDLTALGTEDRVEVWARAASAEVTRIRLDADQTNAGGVIVTVAGVSGAVSGGAVTAVQAYIDARAPITDWITAQNASNVTITAGATVTVPVAQLGPIQVAADAAWTTYLASAQIGGTVYIAQLLKAVMDAGAIDISAMLLNGVAADVILSSSQVPVPNGSGLATLLNWVSV